jgi:hypothetical protein
MVAVITAPNQQQPDVHHLHNNEECHECILCIGTRQEPTVNQHRMLHISLTDTPNYKVRNNGSFEDNGDKMRLIIQVVGQPSTIKTHELRTDIDFHEQFTFYQTILTTDTFICKSNKFYIVNHILYIN